MTEQLSVELGFPNCDTKQKATLYESIDVSFDPTLKEKPFKKATEKVL